jgi:preprotein translocase subunit SecE
MNREMRRIQEREERLQKKQDTGKDKTSRRAAALQSKPQTERKSFIQRIGAYLHEVRQEMRKVTWPTREQMIAFTTVTLVTIVVLTFVIFGIDFVMKEFVFKIFEWAQ